jgi:oligoendopeptidase F
MGHAVHSVLAKDRFPFVAHSTLPMAETASVFSEMLLHDTLMREASPEDRVSILSEKLSEIYATVMRQAYFVIFEKEAHRLVPEGATTEDLDKVYLEQLRQQFGPVDVPDDFQREWQYIPHIYATPFYCYAYSFGMLLSLALYGKYREEGQAFVPKYEALLAAGGSDSPENLLRKLDVDIRDRRFWQKGFQLVREMMDELEKSAPTK